MKIILRMSLMLIVIMLASSCSANDGHLNERYDRGRSSVMVIKRLEFNEQKGQPFILNVEKAEKLKNERGTEYVYMAKDGSRIRIVAVFKIFNESDQSFYYILENEAREPVANVKLITNKKGRVISAEVVDGK